MSKEYKQIPSAVRWKFMKLLNESIEWILLKQNILLCILNVSVNGICNNNKVTV